MKRLPSFRFAIEVLLVTNIWIFFYNSLLSFLNSRFPPKISEIFYITGAAPEPFEIPLYLGLTFLFVILIFLLHRWIFKAPPQAAKTRASDLSFSYILEAVVFLLLFSIFIINIGEYPLRGNPDPYLPRTNTSFYQVSFVLYVVTVAFLTAQLTIIKRMIDKLGHYAYLITAFLVVIIIALFIFEPNFPISGMDYSFFSGPIWEVTHGRTIITETPSQYGILPILFFVFLSKLHLFRITYLPYFFWTLFVFEYFLLFYLIYKIGRSYLLALIALFSIVTINYFSIAHIPLFTPQAGPLRWLPMFFTLFLFFRQKKIDAKPMIFFIALSSYWILDTGLYLIMAYLLTLFILTISQTIEIKKAAKAVFWLFIYVIVILLVLDGVHLFFGYKYLNIFLAFSKIQQYSRSGFNMIRIFPKTYFWFLLLFYFASLIYFFKKREHDFFDQLVLFAANLSFFGGVYFVGRSHPHTLFWIAPLALFNFFLLVIHINAQLESEKIKLFISLVLFLLFIVFPIYNRKEVMLEKAIAGYKRIATGNILFTELDPYLKKKYSLEKDLIDKHLKDDKVAIIHADDTYLLYMTNKQNLLLTNPQTSIVSPDDLMFALQDVYRVCPQKIAVDCRFVGKCSENWTFSGITNFIQPYLLDALQKKCNTTYKPTICTNQLCIAEGTNNR